MGYPLSSLSREEQYVNVLSVLAAFGVVYAIPYIYCILNVLWLYFLRPSSIECCLHGSAAPYAIVTGATDEIGKATVVEFSTRGFNAILHGRNGRR